MYIMETQAYRGHPIIHINMPTIGKYVLINYLEPGNPELKQASILLDEFLKLPKQRFILTPEKD